MFKFINVLMNSFRKFDVVDIGIFKTLLLSIGMLIGSSASKTCRKLRPLLIPVMIFSYIWTLYRLWENAFRNEYTNDLY